jgi:hypothetical protein
MCMCIAAVMSTAMICMYGWSCVVCIVGGAHVQNCRGAMCQVMSPGGPQLPLFPPHWIVLQNKYSLSISDIEQKYISDHRRVIHCTPSREKCFTALF